MNQKSGEGGTSYDSRRSKTALGAAGVVQDSGLLRVMNFGLIAGTGGRPGVQATNAWLEMTNSATGTISGAVGISSSIPVGPVVNGEKNDMHITNAGSIVGTHGLAISLDDPLVQDNPTRKLRIVNAATGVMRGIGGIAATRYVLSLDNAGLIEGGAGTGVSLKNGTGVTVNNSGVMSGAIGLEIQDGATSVVENTGRIEGTSGLAVGFAGNDLTLLLGTGSDLVGDATATGAGNAVVLQGTAAEDSAFSGFATLSMDGEAWRLSGNSTFLESASFNSGALELAGSVTAPVATIAAGATLFGGGVLAADVNNAGVIKPGPLADGTGPFGAFTIRGNYVGAGGTLRLNTVLGGDASPTDSLILAGGAATGTTMVSVSNAGGVGAATVNGIRVIETRDGATTDPGAFTLSGQLRAGLFSYRLARGGASSAQDWFLISSLTNPDVKPIEPIQPIEPNQPDQPDQPVVPGGGGGSPGFPPVFPAIPANRLLGMPQPILEAEVSVYSAIQPLTRMMGKAFVGTFNERAGDVAALGAGPDAAIAHSGRASAGAAWGRIIGQHYNNTYLSLASPRARGDLAGLQVGLDLFRGDLFGRGAFDSMGVYFAAGRTRPEIRGLVTNPALQYDLARTGRVVMDAYSGGAYWTHVTRWGLYVDAVAQLTRYQTLAETQIGLLKNRGHGVIASLEAGYPIALPIGADVVIEPQGQFIWQHVAMADSADRHSIIDPGKSTGASGRVGVRGRWTLRDDMGRSYQTYVRINLWQESGGRSMISYNHSQFAAVVDRGRRLELSGGAIVKMNDALSMFANAGWTRDIQTRHRQTRREISGTVGLRYNW